MSPLSFIANLSPFNPQKNVATIYKRESRRSDYIPLFGNKVSAGFPSPAADYVEARLSADQYLVDNPIATYFVRVKGDSMEDAGIKDGDVLVIDRSLDPTVGQIVLAEVDGEFTVKYLGRGELIPANEKYKPITFRDAQTVVVIGVVIGSMRRY